MRKLVFTVLAISLTLHPRVVLAQRSATNHLDKQRAEQIADHFVERFEQTLDFGIVWKALRLSDSSCAHRANGILGEDDYARLGLSADIVEKLYIGTMNVYYLKAVYELSHSLIDSKSEPASAPAEIEALIKRSKFFEGDEHKPQSQEEVIELIGTLDQLAQLYRKHIPKRAMKSPVWRANEKYLRSRNTTDHEGVLNGSETFCIGEGSNVYIVDRGIFYFYIVNEGGKMRVAGLGID